MTTDNQDSGEKDLRGLIAFVPIAFLFLLLFLVFRCEPFAVASQANGGTQRFVSGDESSGGEREEGSFVVTRKKIGPTPTPDPVVLLAPKADTIPTDPVIVKREPIGPTATPNPVVVTKKDAPVPATATPVPAPTPTPESPSGVTAAKLPSPDPDPTATSTPAPTAVPTPKPTAVKNVSVGGGGESVPTATPESAIDGPGDITTSEEIPVELNFDIILERLTNQNYRPEIDFGNGGGFIPVEIIEKEDGSVAVVITAQYSDLGEYEGQLRLVNVRGEVITVDNFVVNVVPTLTVTAPTVMSFSGIIKADMEKPLVEVDFYPFKAVSVISSAEDDVLYAEVDWGVGKGFVSGIVHSNTGQFIGSYNYDDSGIYVVTIKFTSDLGGLEETVIEIEVSYGSAPGVTLPTATPTPGPTATPIPGATATPTPAPTSTPIPAGTFLLKWGTQGSGDGQFDGPWGVAVDSSGNVYVADVNNDRVQKFDSSGNFLLKWGSNSSGDGQFNAPRGVAVDSSGNVYVADVNNDRVQKFDSSGNFLMKWGSSGTGDGQFSIPWGVVVDGSGNVYVSGRNNDRVQKFDSSGNFLLKWGSYGTGDGQFRNPHGVAVDGSGNVYVVDGRNNRVQKFDSSGNFLLKWGSNGWGDGQFINPWGIAVDSSGNVYVVNGNANRVQKFDSSGNFITKWGSNGSGDGQFNSPRGVALDGSRNIYVTGLDNNRIQKFTSGE